ncbi:GNAT family N-acetyltransferase [Sphingomonas mollis]|uniref:N-acetyltransferase n=1 Tax=Sphingomonas mollis TaxID=2795726 RepID=A0ABS0XQ71_9SPHN|nr:N-acetyltransferase [Sphingomonas sp. BT553]MBJ6122186.1 N-acetyltransferase [Sphingomonas sp. BT553]
MLAIRPAAPGDVAAIDDLLLASFPAPAEARLIGDLCAEGDMVLLLVAAEEGSGQIAGVAAFSRMDVSVADRSVPSVALAPVAVAGDHRRQGVAEALVTAGMERLEAEGVVLCFVLGDPAFYTRFGFDPLCAKGFASPYAGDYLMATALQGGLMPCGVRGEARHAAAFARLGQSA